VGIEEFKPGGHDHRVSLLFGPSGEADKHTAAMIPDLFYRCSGDDPQVGVLSMFSEMAYHLIRRTAIRKEGMPLQQMPPGYVILFDHGDTIAHSSKGACCFHAGNTAAGYNYVC